MNSVNFLITTYFSVEKLIQTLTCAKLRVVFDYFFKNIFLTHLFPMLYFFYLKNEDILVFLGGIEGEN